MTTIERLRPQIRPLEEEWSAVTLAEILATPVDAQIATSARRRRRIRVAAAGLVGAGVLGSGAAYAGGMVPGFVTDAFQRLDGQAGEDFDVSGVKPIADFALPDGTRYTVWRGRNKDGGSCEAIREDRPGRVDDETGFGYGCNSGPSAAGYDQVSFGWVQEEDQGGVQAPMYFLAYGEAPVATATQVRITGIGMAAKGGSPLPGNATDVTLPVDRATRGFGGSLTGLKPAQWHILTYVFLDASGAEVARLTGG